MTVPYVGLSSAVTARVPGDAGLEPAETRDPGFFPLQQTGVPDQRRITSCCAASGTRVAPDPSVLSDRVLVPKEETESQIFGIFASAMTCFHFATSAFT
jgi:hypothetical protein